MVEKKKPILLLLFALVLVTGSAFAPSKSRPSRKLPSHLRRVFFNQLCDDGCSEEEKAHWRRNIHWDFYDLNNDSVPEYFLSIWHPDWCGAGSNCDVWVYEQKGAGFRLLASDKGLRPHRKYTRGYRDLFGDVKMGASQVQGKFEYYRTLYRFNGRTYIESSGKYVQR